MGPVVTPTQPKRHDNNTNDNTCRLLSRKLGSFIEISKQIEQRALKGNWSLALARAITSNIIAIPGKGINQFW